MSDDQKLKLVALDIETSGLDPENDFISVIGVMTAEGIRQFSTLTAEHEREVLIAFIKFLEEMPLDEGPLLTYNGRHFDIPFIYKRAEVHNLEVPKNFGDNHIDLAPLAYSLDGRRIPKNMFLSKYLNIYVPRTCSGAWMARTYTSPQLVDFDVHAQALYHNATDLVLTIRAYLQCKRYPDFESYEQEQIMKRMEDSEGK